MTTSRTSHAAELMHLAERMGIPVDEAIRQLAQLVADADADPPVVAPAAAETVVGSAVA